MVSSQFNMSGFTGRLFLFVLFAFFTTAHLSARVITWKNVEKDQDAWCSCVGEVDIEIVCLTGIEWQVWAIPDTNFPLNHTLIAESEGTGFVQHVNIYDLCPGTYYYGIAAYWDSGNGPEWHVDGWFYTIEIEGPEEFLGVSLDAPEPSLCFVSQWIDATITGGNGGNTITWKKDGVPFPAGDGENFLEEPTNGTYEITVTDSKGCTVSESITIDQTAEEITFDLVATQQPGCEGDSSGVIEIHNLNVEEWDDIRWFEIVDGVGNPLFPFDVFLKENLPPGTYRVQITTDPFGCQAEREITIEAGSPVSIQAEITADGCTAGSKGSIEITPTGGTGHTYDWSHDPNLNGNLADDLDPGTYQVTVTNAEGCTVTESFTVPDVPDFDPIGLNVVQFRDLNGNCKATACVTGLDGNGTPPYTFEWEGLPDTDDCVTIDVPGQLRVIVTDDNGCMQVAISDQPTCVADGPVIDISPNPNNGTFNAEIHVVQDANVKFIIVDQAMAIVWQENKGQQTAGTHTFNLDARPIAPGTYYLLTELDGAQPNSADMLIIQ